MNIFGALKRLTKRIINPLKSTKSSKEQSFLGVFKQELQLKKVEASRPDIDALLTRKPMPKSVYERIIARTKPRFESGFWRRPELSAIGLSRIKKRYILAGYDWPRKPHRDLSKVYENARTTFFHPDKIKRLEKIAAAMEKMPELIRQFESKQEKDRLSKEMKEHMTEQEIYQRAISKDISADTPEWLQERIEKSKAKKLKIANEKALKKKSRTNL